MVAYTAKVRAALFCLLLLGACSKGSQVRPFVELEHRRSHELESRLGANIETSKHSIDVYWAPIWRVSDHVSSGKFKADYYSAVGVRWRMR